MKQCSRCKRELPPTAFAVDRTRGDGLSKWCRECVAEKSRAHYEARRGEILARQAQRRAANPEHFRALARASRERHRDRHRAYNRARYYANREEILAKTRWLHIAKKYGLSPEEFERRLALQGNACAICGITDVPTWHVDHDHACCPDVVTCGRCIRGILCRSCNQALGGFRDDPALLDRAAAYLRAGPIKPRTKRSASKSEALAT